MPRHHRPHLLVICVVATTLCACGTPPRYASFVTKTSFSLLDADVSPPSITVAYDRFEGYVGPRFADGKVYPVAGFVETRGGFFDRSIHQVYAGGRAALIATTPGTTVPPPPIPPRDTAPPRDEVLIFATATTLGLKITFASNVPTSFTFGYKRKEASIVPVDPERQPSILASLDNTVKVDTPNASDFGVGQYFATGEAADHIAGLASIRAKFQDKAEEALGPVAAFRTQEALQGRAALDTTVCLAAAPDTALPKVWSNADALGIFAGTTTVARIQALPTPAQQRNLYTSRLAALLDPASSDFTTRLRLHHDAVCALDKG